MVTAVICGMCNQTKIIVTRGKDSLYICVKCDWNEDGLPTRRRKR